jgi:hypothetical protein
MRHPARSHAGRLDPAVPGASRPAWVLGRDAFEQAVGTDAERLWIGTELFEGWELAHSDD